jgi:hypothetical protein
MCLKIQTSSREIHSSLLLHLTWPSAYAARVKFMNSYPLISSDACHIHMTRGPIPCKVYEALPELRAFIEALTCVTSRGDVS